MKNTTLLIMAAGIGSRFGGGIKQLEPVGLHNEIIMDYSIHDAIKAGFNKIIFVIRKDIEDDFRERIGNRVEFFCEKQNVEIDYAFQDLNNVPGKVPEGRTKSIKQILPAFYTTTLSPGTNVVNLRGNRKCQSN